MVTLAMPVLIAISTLVLLDPQQELYIGLDAERLFAAAGAGISRQAMTDEERELYAKDIANAGLDPSQYLLDPSEPLVQRSVESNGVRYKLLDGTTQLGEIAVRIAVHPSIEKAKEFFAEYVVSVAPTPLQENIGDERKLWVTAPEVPAELEKYRGGHVLFRRENIVVHLDWRGQTEDALNFAREIDVLLQSDVHIAPRGRFFSMPKIETLSMPANVIAGKPADMQFRVLGLPPGRQVDFVVSGEAGRLSRLRGDGEVTIELPKMLGDTGTSPTPVDVMVVAAD